MKVIIISGTPGTGKTTLAKNIAKNTGSIYVDVNKVISESNLEEEYDQKRKCKVIDTKKLNKILINLIKDSKKTLIIDSHLSHYLPKKYVDLCVITKCDLKILKKRLIKRKYSPKKIEENLECEIFDVCLNEAIENKHQVKIIDTTLKKKIKYKNLLKRHNFLSSF